jgi:hypothetical protein
MWNTPSSKTKGTMAIVNDVFVSGSVGNLVLYRRMGKSCSRIKPLHVKQSAATKIRGLNFGIAARAGRGLRRGLTAVMPLSTDRSMQSRFSGAIAKWLGLSNVEELPPCEPAPYLSSFQFTTGATFSERFRVPVTVSQPQDDVLTVGIDAFIPALHIAAPAGTVSVTLVISVAACLLKSGWATGSQTHTLPIPYNDTEIPAQSLAFHVPTSAGSLTVTAARLIYQEVKNGQVMNVENPAFMPASVINARYGVTP